MPRTNTAKVVPLMPAPEDVADLIRGYLQAGAGVDAAQEIADSIWPMLAHAAWSLQGPTAWIQRYKYLKDAAPILTLDCPPEQENWERSPLFELER